MLSSTRCTTSCDVWATSLSITPEIWRKPCAVVDHKITLRTYGAVGSMPHSPTPQRHLPLSMPSRHRPGTFPWARDRRHRCPKILGSKGPTVRMLERMAVRVPGPVSGPGHHHHHTRTVTASTQLRFKTQRTSTIPALFQRRHRASQRNSCRTTGPTRSANQAKGSKPLSGLMSRPSDDGGGGPINPSVVCAGSLTKRGKAKARATVSHTTGTAAVTLLK